MTKISKNLKSSYWAQKTHLYELICHPHIEEDQSKPVYFIKKIRLIKKKFINMIFMIFVITMELHRNDKSLKSQINLIFLDQTDFFPHIFYMWVTYELI